MGAIRDLSNAIIQVLKDRQPNIDEQIAILVENAREISLAKYFLFYVDEWYYTCFYAIDRTGELTENELEWPEFLTDAFTEAHNIDDDADYEDEDKFFNALYEPIIKSIEVAWAKADGHNLAQPAYISFHDASDYYDLKQGEYVNEDVVARTLDYSDKKLHD
jgi:hypothetical protein